MGKNNDKYYQHTDDLIDYIKKHIHNDEVLNNILLYQDNQIDKYNKINNVSKKTALLSGLSFLVTGSRKFKGTKTGKTLRVVSSVFMGVNSLLYLYSASKLDKYKKENKDFQDYVNDLDDNNYDLDDIEDDIDEKEHTRIRK